MRFYSSYLCNKRHDAGNVRCPMNVLLQGLLSVQFVSVVMVHSVSHWETWSCISWGLISIKFCFGLSNTELVLETQFFTGGKFVWIFAWEMESNRATRSPDLYCSNFVFVQVIMCPTLMLPGKNRLLTMFLLLFLPLAYHHPTGVFVSQGPGGAAYHSGSDVSGKWNRDTSKYTDFV